MIYSFTDGGSGPQRDNWEHGHHSGRRRCACAAGCAHLVGGLLHQHPPHRGATIRPHAGKAQRGGSPCLVTHIGLTFGLFATVCRSQRRTNNYWPSMKFRNQGCQSSYAEVELGGHEKEGFIEAEHCYWVRRGHESQSTGKEMDNLTRDKEHRRWRPGSLTCTSSRQLCLFVFSLCGFFFFFLVFVTAQELWGTSRKLPVQERWHANINYTH